MATPWRATDTVSVSALGNAQVTRPLDDTPKFVHPAYAWHEYRWNASANHFVIDLHAPSILFVVLPNLVSTVGRRAVDHFGILYGAERSPARTRTTHRSTSTKKKVIGRRIDFVEVTPPDWSAPAT